jgi:hypothetical protein
MLTSWAREREDLSTDKTDDKDAALVAQLTAQLRCHLPDSDYETLRGRAWEMRSVRNGFRLARAYDAEVLVGFAC